MTDPQGMTDIGQIAASLSEAQRRVLAAFRPGELSPSADDLSHRCGYRPARSGRLGVSRREERIHDAEAAILTMLAEHGIRPDVQEQLVQGDGRGTVPPGALRKIARLFVATYDAGVASRETSIVLWLDQAPNDWPFTGRDIAGLIRAGQVGTPWTPDQAERRSRDDSILGGAA